MPELIFRGGRLQEADRVWCAWTSQDLKAMLKEIDTPTNPIDRHFLLQSIVKETYKLRRKDNKMRDLCEEIAWKHINEFPSLAESLKDIDGNLPRVPTFQHLSTVLVEKDEYEAAIKVCETALSLGLHDGTKGGFQGRIERITKKKG